MNILPWWWRWAALAILMAAVAITSAAKMHQFDSHRYEALQGAFQTFKDGVQNAGIASEKARVAQEKRDGKLKEKSDEAYRGTISRMDADAKRLHDERTSGGFIPEAPPGAKRPDRVTFDRPKLERALEQLDAEVSGIVADGDHARVGLDTGKAWVKDLSDGD